MKVEDFDYPLNEDLIAQTPLVKRDESKLMVLDKRIEIEYTLFILGDVIGTHKIWITK